MTGIVEQRFVPIGRKPVDPSGRAPRQQCFSSCMAGGLAQRLVTLPLRSWERHFTIVSGTTAAWLEPGPQRQGWRQQLA